MGKGSWSSTITTGAPDNRRRLALLLGTVGVVAHNWWVVIYPLGWMPSWHALISEAEASDQPHSRLLSNIDIVVGVLVMAGVLLVGREYRNRRGRVLWWLALAWGLFGLLEGAFPLACSPSTNLVCEEAEWRFELAYHHYVHMGSGVLEYLSANLIAILAWRMNSLGWMSRFGRWMTIAMVVCYPFMGWTFFTHRWSTISEAMFFVMYSTTVGAVLWFRPPGGGSTSLLADDAVGDGSLGNGRRDTVHHGAVEH